MSGTTQIRPKCKLDSVIEPESVINEINRLLPTTDNIEGKVVDNYIYLKIPQKDQHYWSPEMRVSIKESETGSTITSLVGPNGKVWATFMVFYGLAVMLLIFGGSLGISQWLLNIDSFWIWSIPISIVLYVAIIAAAKYGQRLGKEQHLVLRYFLDEAIAQAENNASNSTETTIS